MRTCAIHGKCAARFHSIPPQQDGIPLDGASSLSHVIVSRILIEFLNRGEIPLTQASLFSQAEL